VNQFSANALRQPAGDLRWETIPLARDVPGVTRALGEAHPAHVGEGEPCLCKRALAKCRAFQRLS